MAVQRRTAPNWTDVVGQTYSPGDVVAVSIINGRSPQTVIARVEAIYLDDSKGKPYHETQAFRLGADMQPLDQSVTLTEDDEVVPHAYGGGTAYRHRQSCAVQCTPLIDARGFNRWSDRKVSYTIPMNIVKVGVTAAQLEDDQG